MEKKITEKTKKPLLTILGEMEKGDCIHVKKGLYAKSTLSGLITAANTFLGDEGTYSSTRKVLDGFISFYRRK